MTCHLCFCKLVKWIVTVVTLVMHSLLSNISLVTFLWSSYCSEMISKLIMRPLHYLENVRSLKALTETVLKIWNPLIIWSFWSLLCRIWWSLLQNVSQLWQLSVESSTDVLFCRTALNFQINWQKSIWKTLTYLDTVHLLLRWSLEDDSLPFTTACCFKISAEHCKEKHKR